MDKPLSPHEITALLEDQFFQNGLVIGELILDHIVDHIKSASSVSEIHSLIEDFRKEFVKEGINSLKTDC